MRYSSRGFAITIVCVFLTFQATGQTNQRRRAFQILTPNLPVPVARTNYEVELKAVGGKPPYHWTIQGNPLPAGLALDENRGVIAGLPVTNHEFSVVVQVSDSSEPRLVVAKLLVASAGAPLTVRWTVPPHVIAGNLSGAVRVSNASKDLMDMTVIVVAVNELGKAFALRYERLNLAPGTETPDLQFDSALPLGQYTAHVDAVGEVAQKKAIYRDRREQGGLVVQTQ